MGCLPPLETASPPIHTPLQAMEAAASQRMQDVEVERDEALRSLSQHVQQVGGEMDVWGGALRLCAACRSM